MWLALAPRCSGDGIHRPADEPIYWQKQKGMSDMIERLWRHDALRVQLQSRIGVVVASAVLLIAGQSATAQEFFDFEDPPYTGSAAGTIITGQDGFYIPVPDSQDGLVYTYLDNALGLPTNP